MVAALCSLVLLLAPETAHKLEYRFKKGMVIEETTRREPRLRLFDAGRIIKQHMVVDQILERTILEVDGKGRPVVERVFVKKWTANFIAWPDREEGVKKNAAQGLTLVWRKKRDGRWGLFGAKGEVTAKYPGLVERLAPWRQARLPKTAVKLGATWEVEAKTFLETAGMQVPKNVAGRAKFKLEEVNKGVAWISFSLKMVHHDAGRQFTAVQRGIWRFDIVNGRDVSMRSDGEIEADGGRSGFGSVTMTRKVVYR